MPLNTLCLLIRDIFTQGDLYIISVCLLKPSTGLLRRSEEKGAYLTTQACVTVSLPNCLT